MRTANLNIEPYRKNMPSSSRNDQRIRTTVAPDVPAAGVLEAPPQSNGQLAAVSPADVSQNLSLLHWTEPVCVCTAPPAGGLVPVPPTGLVPAGVVPGTAPGVAAPGTPGLVMPAPGMAAPVAGTAPGVVVKGQSCGQVPEFSFFWVSQTPLPHEQS